MVGHLAVHWVDVKVEETVGKMVDEMADKRAE